MDFHDAELLSRTPTGHPTGVSRDIVAGST